MSPIYQSHLQLSSIYSVLVSSKMNSDVTVPHFLCDFYTYDHLNSVYIPEIYFYTGFCCVFDSRWNMRVYLMVRIWSEGRLCPACQKVEIFLGRYKSESQISDFALWYYLLSFTSSYHFPVTLTIVTATWSSFNSLFHVLIRLSWNLVYIFFSL